MRYWYLLVSQMTIPVTRIAAEIGRHRSTVYREIGRNVFTDDELDTFGSDRAAFLLYPD